MREAKYMHEEEVKQMEKSTPCNWLGHIFMIALLLLIVLWNVKSLALYENQGFSYLYAFGIPSSLLVLVGSWFIYDRYLSKLSQSHQ